MGERLLCKQEVDGSIPFTSTRAAGVWRRATIGKCGFCRPWPFDRGRAAIFDRVKRE